MKRYDYLIIGGGIAGVTAAEAIRGEDPAGTIGILSDERHLLYSRVLLPSYLKKRIKRERVFLRTAKDFTRRRIDLYRDKAAIAVDIKRREVAAADGETFGYKKLLIASGGKTNRLPADWGGEQAYGLQTLDDADRLLVAIPNIREPLVIGSSFIALEFIEIFILNGVIPMVLTKSETPARTPQALLCSLILF